MKLKSKDPLDTPDICFHYFEEGNDASGDDLEGILAGIEVRPQPDSRPTP